MKPQPHTCRESRDCVCSLQALAPDEECPRHGAGEFPPRCEVCGRFIKRPDLEEKMQLSEK